MTGGDDGSNKLDTTEIYQDNVWRTVSGKLPVPMWGMNVRTISNRLILTGKLLHRLILFIIYFLKFLGGEFMESSSYKYRTNIMEFNKQTEKWKDIGTMKNGISYHAVSVVDYHQYAKWCI